jgi:hypothetical protein
MGGWPASAAEVALQNRSSHFSEQVDCLASRQSALADTSPFRKVDSWMLLEPAIPGAFAAVPRQVLALLE